MFEIEDNIKVPESLDEYTRKGILLGVKKKRAGKIKLMANAMIICIFILFTMLVRISPAFAVFVANVPGMDYLVKLINYDKGLKSAVENNFVQNLNSSVTKEGIKFTIKDVIIDKAQTLIFYSIEDTRENRRIILSEMNIRNEKGEKILASTSWCNNMPYAVSGDNKVEDRIDVNFIEGTDLPDKLCIEFKLKEELSGDSVENYEKILNSSWNFGIPVDKEKIKAMEKNYVLNQIVEVSGQKITFKEVKITPTRIAVKAEYDENNTKKILGFDDIAFVNEKGETWETIKNGYSGSRTDENHETLYFQSNYFNVPKNLYIKGCNIRALDKDKLNVVVDLQNKILLKAPDERLKLKEIVKNGDEISISFSLKKDTVFDDKIEYDIFSFEFKDLYGNTYKQKRCETWSDILNGEQNTQIIKLLIDDNPKIKGPLYIELSNYPERIRGDFEVKIK